MKNKSEIRIEFWILLWENLIDNFLKKQSFGLNLYNPHILVDDIITEIEENGFRNIENKKFFYSKLNYYMDSDPVIKSNIISKFKIARKVFNSDKNSYLLQILKDIKLTFQEGFYFDKALDLLVDELLNEEEINGRFIKSINNLSQVIIIELIKKHYALDDIKLFVKNIFDIYELQDDGRTTTSFPHNIDYKDYEQIDGRTESKFYEDVIKLIDSLNTKERLKSLANYYYKKSEKAYYIFVVEGLKGEINEIIGGVTFYSLDKKRFIDFNELDFDYENLQKDKKSNIKFIQAAVEVDYLLPYSSLPLALSKLENALDLISAYFNTKTELEINSSNFIIAKENRWIFHSSKADKRESHSKFSDSLDLSEVLKEFTELNNKEILWSDKSNTKTIIKIKNAIHWYRKAQQSAKPEDKLLNYWIALENLLNFEKSISFNILNKPKSSTIHLIQEVIISNQIFPFSYKYGWELHSHYVNQVDSFFKKPKLTLPKELITNAQLDNKPGQTIYLKKFIENLPEIRTYETNSFFLEKIDEVINFYNNSTAMKTLKEYSKQTEEDILMIYRFRNLIVHNAHFDNTLLTYYVWKVKQFSGNLIRTIIELIDVDKDLTQIILEIHYKREYFFTEIENGKFNIFD